MSEICKVGCLRAWLSWNYYFLFQYLNVPRQKCLKRLHANVSIKAFCTGLLITWCWCIWGCRSVVDLNSLKAATVHIINETDGWASTVYPNGRNKLSGKKRGSRAWSAFFVCLETILYLVIYHLDALKQSNLHNQIEFVFHFPYTTPVGISYMWSSCPGGKHQPVPSEWAWTLDLEGNPRNQPPFCTSCPLNCLRLKQIRAGANPFHLFSKWTKTQQSWGGNHGDVVGIAKSWLDAQGAGGERETDRHSGRKALAGWLEKTNAPYAEGFEIHGDLQYKQFCLNLFTYSKSSGSPDKYGHVNWKNW